MTKTQQERFDEAMDRALASLEKVFSDPVAIAKYKSLWETGKLSKEPKAKHSWPEESK